MPTAATIRSTATRIDDATAIRIADHWTAAYPVMREIVTARITAYRQQISDEAWQVGPNHPQAEAIRAHTLTEAQLVRRLKQVEALRLELGQLDRGTHRACTRSPGRVQRVRRLPLRPQPAQRRRPQRSRSGAGVPADCRPRRSGRRVAPRMGGEHHRLTPHHHPHQSDQPVSNKEQRS